MFAPNQLILLINTYHFEADEAKEPEKTTHRAMRDQLIAQAKERGYRIRLLKADWLESCGRYTLNGSDGYHIIAISAGTCEEV